MQPINYNVQSPSQAFAQSYQFVNNIRQQKAQQNRQQAMQQAIETIRTNPNPQNLAEIYLQFPELKEAGDAYTQTLAEPEINAERDAAQKGMLLVNSGRADELADFYSQRAEAAANSGMDGLAKKFADAAQFAESNPEEAGMMTRMKYFSMDEQGYKTLFDSKAGDPTTLQKDFAFIEEKFGPEAAAEYAQYGRGGIVSVPLGKGQTYVGPAANAPGASRWAANGPPAGTKTPSEILEGAQAAKSITAAEADIIRKSLGPDGRTEFNKWIRENKVRVIARTGTDKEGRRVVQYQDGTIEYAD